jgi:hypothetical protein
MKRSITFLLCALLLLSPISPVFAADQNEKDLQAQLNALREYLVRIQGNTTTTPLTQKEMHSVITEGISWMLEAQEESGHFRYEYVPYEDVYLQDDNIVRQGGALFILGETYRKNPDVVSGMDEGIEKAIEYFESLSVSDTKDDFRCVANTEGSGTCKLGATALVLLGILGYVEGNPSKESTYEDLIEDYTTYILSAQKDEGGFSNAYRKTKGFEPEESPFSNGEALLALVRAYQYEEDAQVKESIDDAFLYLKDKEFDSALYLWAMAALKDMERLWPNPVYVSYTHEFTEWRMARATRTPKDRNTCAYIEGVTSAYSIVPESDASTRSLLRSEIDTFNRFHRTLQLSEDDLYRVENNDEGVKLVKLSKPTRAQGGFLTAHSVPTQRIDFTQHCVSAYLQTLTDIDKAEL